MDVQKKLDICIFNSNSTCSRGSLFPKASYTFRASYFREPPMFFELFFFEDALELLQKHEPRPLRTSYKNRASGLGTIL